jgi:hypothetical protein
MRTTSPLPVIASRPQRRFSLALKNVPVVAVSLFLKHEVALVGLGPRSDSVHAR